METPGCGMTREASSAPLLFVGGAERCRGTIDTLRHLAPLIFIQRCFASGLPLIDLTVMRMMLPMVNACYDYDCGVTGYGAEVASGM